MQLPQIIEAKGIRVLTTKQIAEEYGAREIQISQNFTNNRMRFIEGKHYISLSGDELRAFKKHFEKIELVNNRTSHLYLWTEKGALLHAKSLNTDKAWEVYDYLVDFYFRKKSEPATETKTEETQANIDSGYPKWIKPAKATLVDVPENKKAQELIVTMRKYLISMDGLLDVYNMYLTKEEFDKAASVVQCIGEKIYRTGIDLHRFQPKLVEKYL